MGAPQFPAAVQRARLNEQLRRQERGIALAEATAAQQRQQLEFAQQQREAQLAEHRAQLEDAQAMLEARLADQEKAQDLESKRREAVHKQREKAQAKAGSRSPAQMALEAALAGTEVNGRNINQTNPDYAGGGATNAMMEGMTAGGPQPGGPQGVGAPGASTGAPSQPFQAPDTITSTQRTRGIEWAPSRGLFPGYLGLPQDTTTTTTQPNVLTAAQAAELNMAQQQRVAVLAQDLVVNEGVPGDKAVVFAQAVASGDGNAIAQAGAQLPKGVTLRTKEAALQGVQLDNQTRQLQLRMMQQLVAQQGAAAQMDPLTMMGLKDQAAALGLTAGGKLKAGTGGTSAFDLGEWSNAATGALGRGKLDEANPVAVMGLQLGMVQASNGRLMAIVPGKSKGWFSGAQVADLESGLQLYSTGDLVAQVKAATTDPAALQAMLASGMFIEVKGANGASAIAANPGSLNSVNAQLLLNYVQAESLAQAAAQQAGTQWASPLQPNGVDVAKAAASLQATTPAPRAAMGPVRSPSTAGIGAGSPAAKISTALERAIREAQRARLGPRE